jgi:hypothetical protein
MHAVRVVSCQSRPMGPWQILGALGEPVVFPAQ